MKINEIEYTPNPNAVKFIVDTQLTPFSAHAEFKSAEDASGVPLAEQLFAIPHVESVYWTDRWITVTQDGGANWHELLREIAAPLRAATREDAALGDGWEERAGGGTKDVAELEGLGLHDERMPAIMELLEDDILPFLQGDGGGLEVKAFVDNQLFIKYQGACGTCPSSTMGTLLAIENLLQLEVDPKITVVSIDGAYF